MTPTRPSSPPQAPSLISIRPKICACGRTWTAFITGLTPPPRGPIAPWGTHPHHITLPHLHLRRFNRYVPIAGFSLSTLTTVAIDRAILRNPHYPQLPRTIRTSSTWPNNLGMVRVAHRSRTIGRPLHVHVTTSSHKGLLFLATGTRPRDVETL